MSLTVESIMSTEPLSVEGRVPIRDILRLCLDYDVRHVPVLSAGKYAGMVSDRDIQKLLFLSDEQRLTEDLLQTTAAQLMDPSALTLSPGQSAADALDALLSGGKSCCPVVSAEGELLGVVSYVDLLKAVREMLVEH